MNGKPDCLSEWQENCGPLHFHRFTLRKGESVLPHTHAYGHATLIVRGTVTVSLDDTAVTLTAPAHFPVPATALHGMVAESDEAEVWCAFVHRGEAGVPVETYEQGVPAAYGGF